ncbi:AAA family ATPase [Desulfobacula toluolica]|uniref:Putative ATP-dependent endonuclease, OLD family n=1 Tax=Desulfobacula toluolica (strain DSM 7467 / Tol2) TaxID=651182 RepID=K0N9U0_DESTT|nr:AAA family ATPase [Desulfobacula toluolica]CCK80749.1 putative ATP-dependent endonuclease, OLD family [Desulfobacula toluolica Tol2]
MKIKEVKIENWRSIQSGNLSFQDLMIFIGQNNHGKSNILSALLFFFGEIKPQELDFYNESEELHVEIVFSNLDENDKSTFNKYLTSDNEIKVRKTAYFSGNFDYKGYVQNPTTEWLQENNASAYTTRAVAEALPLAEFLPESGRITNANIVFAQTQYISRNSDSIEFSYELESTNFLGLKNVAKGIFGQIFHIPAVRNATDDYITKDSSPFGSLYSKLIEQMSSSNPDWISAKENISGLFGLLNKTDENGNHNAQRPQELTRFEAKLSSHLSSWGAEIDVEIVAPNIDDVFKANTKVWINDGVKTDINRKGHGLQRALIFALIKTIAETLREEHLAAQESEQGTSSRRASNSMFFILEEPELYLHPQAQRALFETLTTLADSGAQVSFSTHSSALVDLERYKSICIVRKDSPTTGTTVCQCTDDIFSGDSKKDFNLSYWVNPDRSELFFAQKVILVEGATEKTVIPFLAQKIECFKHEYSVIDCGSKNNIPAYCGLLNKFSIPYVAVYDVDHQNGKSQQAIESADIATNAITAAIDSDFGTTIALVNDIEEELQMPQGTGSKPYVALEEINKESFEITGQMKSKIEKMFE